MKKSILIISLITAFIITGCQELVQQEEKEETKEQATGPDYSAIPDATVLLEGWELPSLGYSFDALEPYIDKKTVYIHYTKHTMGYYKRFIDAIKNTEMENMDMTEMMKNISQYPENVRKNGGQYYNHVFYWQNLSPDGGEPGPELSEAINKHFGSLEEMMDLFNEAARTQFASGWAWLCLDEAGQLFITKTPNEVNPYMDICKNQGIPIMNIDVWEHAYYLKYQNKRGDYISEFWNLINWNKVNERYAEAIEG